MVRIELLEDGDEDDGINHAPENNGGVSIRLCTQDAASNLASLFNYRTQNNNKNNNNNNNDFGKRINDHPPNHGFTEQQQKWITTATQNKPKYIKGLSAVEKQFFALLKQHMSSETFLMKLIDEWVLVPGALEKERRFYVELGGEKNNSKKKCLTQCINTWFLKLENTKHKERGVPLASNSQQQKVKELFVTFKAKGIRYTVRDFSRELKEINPTFGTKATQPTYDKNGDEKFYNLYLTLVLKPFDDPQHLLTAIIMGMGRYLGFRWQHEIVNAKRSQFTVQQFQGGDLDGVRYLEASMGDRENNPKIRENPDDKYCLLKLYEFMQSKCDDTQVRFLCRVDNHVDRPDRWFYPKNPLGKDSVRKFVKQVAQAAGFTDWEKFTTHNNRDRMITCTASNIHVTVQSSMDQQARHRTRKAQVPYNHNTSRQDGLLQSEQLGGVHGKGGVEPLNSKKRKLKNNDEKEVVVETTSLTKQMVPYNKQSPLIQSKQSNDIATNGNSIKRSNVSRIEKLCSEKVELEQQIELIQSKYSKLKAGAKQNFAVRHKVVVDMYNELVVQHNEVKNQLRTSRSENLKLQHHIKHQHDAGQQWLQQQQQHHQQQQFQQQQLERMNVEIRVLQQQL